MRVWPLPSMEMTLTLVPAGKVMPFMLKGTLDRSFWPMKGLSLILIDPLVVQEERVDVATDSRRTYPPTVGTDRNPHYRLRGLRSGRGPYRCTRKVDLQGCASCRCTGFRRSQARIRRFYPLLEAFRRWSATTYPPPAAIPSASRGLICSSTSTRFIMLSAWGQAPPATSFSARIKQSRCMTSKRMFLCPAGM